MPSGTRRRGTGSFTAALLLAGCCAAACFASDAAASGRADYRRLVAEEPHMGTLVRVTAYVPRGVDGVHALRAAFARVRELDLRFSDYRRDSEVERVAREACQAPVRVSADLFAVLTQAAAIAAHTDGAFDVTGGALTRLWRRSLQQGSPPAPEAIAAARRRMGRRNMVLDPQHRSLYFRRPGMRLDLGGIAKGYAADQALDTLRRRGIDRALVAVAGDIAAGGPPPGETGWPVGIDAVGDPGGVECMVSLSNEAVSTSGDRGRSVNIDGKLYSHIVDPASGRGAPTARAVSVIAPSGVEADGWATALHVVGEAASARILRAVGKRNLRVYWAGEGRACADSNRRTLP